MRQKRKPVSVGFDGRFFVWTNHLGEVDRFATIEEVQEVGGDPTVATIHVEHARLFPYEHGHVVAASKREGGFGLEYAADQMMCDRNELRVAVRRIGESFVLCAVLTDYIEHATTIATERNVIPAHIEPEVLAWLRLAPQGIIVDQMQEPFVVARTRTGSAISLVMSGNQLDHTLFARTVGSTIAEAKRQYDVVADDLVYTHHGMAADSMTEERFEAIRTELAHLSIRVLPLDLDGFRFPPFALAASLAVGAVA